MMNTNIDIPSGKTKIWATQERIAFEALSKKPPQTRLMLSASTKVPLQNLCRYVYKWIRNQTVFIVKIDVCAISGMKAEYLSADRKYAPNSQLRMFG